jgi:hypothetical protein
VICNDYICERKYDWLSFAIPIRKLILTFGKLFEMKKPLEEQLFGKPPFLEQL